MGVKPLPYQVNPATVGDHLRKRRYVLGLRQRDVAELLGVATDTVLTWEANKKRPSLAVLPRITKFLGYDSTPAPQTLGARLLAIRRRLGLTQEDTAKLLSVNEETYRLWEREIRRPSPLLMPRVEAFLANRSAGLLCLGSMDRTTDSELDT